MPILSLLRFFPIRYKLEYSSEYARVVYHPWQLTYLETKL